MSGEQSHRATCAWTGGAAGASGLVLITLVRDGDELIVDRTRSAHFVLEDDSQGALKQVFKEAEEFTSLCGVNEVVLRRAQLTGPDAAGWSARRMEAAIELVPGLVVRPANNQSLARWSKLRADAVPTLEPEAPRSDRRVYEAAVAAARVSVGLATGELKLVDGCIR